MQDVTAAQASAVVMRMCEADLHMSAYDVYHKRSE